MSQVLNEQISKSKEQNYLQEIENLLFKLKENSKTIKNENKQIERLRKVNDKSFGKLKQAVENLRTY
jgi:uncharacterized protein YaaN involved in tellurite resistance